MATPWIILCEGEGDEAFFSQLIEEHSIQNVEVKYRPDPDPGDPPFPTGNQSFERWLTSLKPETGYDTHAGILIATDNDSDPEKSFRNIQRQIKSAKGYGVPGAPMVIAPRQNNLPPIAVLMLPWEGEEGCLETLCLKSALQRRRRIRGCIKSYLECIGTEGWTVSNLDKLRMRCLLSAACKKNPNTGLQYVWTKQKGRPEDLIPLGNKCFNRIINYLANLHKS